LEHWLTVASIAGSFSHIPLSIKTSIAGSFSHIPLSIKISSPSFARK
jgi:hypothetical protein